MGPTDMILKQLDFLHIIRTPFIFTTVTRSISLSCLDVRRLNRRHFEGLETNIGLGLRNE